MAPRYRIRRDILRVEAPGSCDSDCFVQIQEYVGSNGVEIVQPARNYPGGEQRILNVGSNPRELRSLAWQLNYMADYAERENNPFEEVP